MDILDSINGMLGQISGGGGWIGDMKRVPPPSNSDIKVNTLCMDNTVACLVIMLYYLLTMVQYTVLSSNWLTGGGVKLPSVVLAQYIHQLWSANTSTLKNIVFSIREWYTVIREGGTPFSHAWYVLLRI